jgi:type II secretory ATPase GspE/PulE/Tfp pilus assembly ATPase PilB-like protein
MANPNDVFAVDDLRVLTGQPVIAALADAQQLRETIDRAFQHARVESTLGDASSDADAELDTRPTDEMVNDGPIVRLVDALLEQAAEAQASDLHIEPTSDEVIMRLRVDGVLHDTSAAPRTVLRPMVSRLGARWLDIAQTRTAGRTLLCDAAGPNVDIRRDGSDGDRRGDGAALADALRGVVDFAGSASAVELTPEPAFRAQGGVFVTGPTGSGKTSTLYAALSAISTRDKSIVSVEDPVEYRLDGMPDPGRLRRG